MSVEDVVDTEEMPSGRRKRSSKGRILTDELKRDIKEQEVDRRERTHHF